MTDRYVVFKITPESYRYSILAWAQYYKNKGQPALFRVVKETLTVFFQEESGHTENSCPVDWFVECQGLSSMFLNIRDWGLTESTDTMLFGRYNLDTKLEFIGTIDNLPDYQQWLGEQNKSGGRLQQLHTLQQENAKLKQLLERIDADRAKLRDDIEKLRQEFYIYVEKSRSGVKDEAFD